MPTSLTQRIAMRLPVVTAQYHRLVLVVGPCRTGKTAALRDLSQQRTWPLVNLNLAMAERMLELTRRQRRLRASTLVEDALLVPSGDAVLVDNIELLFHPDLCLDPLPLLQKLARARTIVASWPGQVRGATITYANPSHPEHRAYDCSNLEIVASDAPPGPDDPRPALDQEHPS